MTDHGSQTVKLLKWNKSTLKGGFKVDAHMTFLQVWHLSQIFDVMTSWRLVMRLQFQSECKYMDYVYGAFVIAFWPFWSLTTFDHCKLLYEKDPWRFFKYKFFCGIWKYLWNISLNWTDALYRSYSVIAVLWLITCCSISYTCFALDKGLPN